MAINLNCPKKYEDLYGPLLLAMYIWQCLQTIEKLLTHKTPSFHENSRMNPLYLFLELKVIMFSFLGLASILIQFYSLDDIFIVDSCKFHYLHFALWLVSNCNLTLGGKTFPNNNNNNNNNV